MRFGVLGPLLVERDERPVDLGSRRQRALLARLVLARGQPLSVARLVDDLWGEHPPDKAGASLQAYVSNLRKALEPGRPRRDTGGVLRSQDPGYLLDLAGHDLDVEEFHAAAARCRELAAAGDLARAREAGERALRVWRGPVLVDLVEEYGFAQRAADQLDAERAALTEELLAVRVGDGDHLAALADLEAAVAAHPFRERGWELLVRALYRAGRTVEALERCRQAQALVRDELGIEPGTALLDLEQAVLRRDPALDPVAPTVAVGSPTPRGATAAAAEQGAAAVPAASVPVPAVELVGRVDDVAAVSSLLREHRLVSVTGPGGVGKTSLALHVAAGLSSAFPHGAVFVPLASLADPALVLPTLARAVGLAQPVGDVFAALGLALSGRRLLVVLDNVEHVLPAAVDVARVLEVCPSVTFLVTGRAPLRLRGEHEYPLSPLPTPDPDRRTTPHDLLAAPAARLFVERARALLPGYAVESAEDAEAVAAICRRLDGLPLALELAAAWLRVLTPGELLRRLDRSLSVLTGGPRDLPERQRTVRGTVAWSVDLLEPPERDLFVRLAVFRGGWTLDAAESVTPGGDGGDEVALGHAALVERSLVGRVPDPPAGAQRFTMLETVREFGLEQLAGHDDADDLRERHAEHFRRLAARAGRGLVGPEQEAWLARMGAEHANVRAAMGWYCDTGNPSAAAEIAWHIRWFWHIRGFQAEGRRWMTRVLAGDGLDATARARARAVDGQCAFGQGLWDEAAPLLDAAHAEHASRELEAGAASIAGHVAVGRAAWDDAVRWSDLALHAYAGLDDPAGAGIAALLPVQTTAASGALDEADRLLDDAEDLLRRAGGSWGIAVALNIRVMIGQLAGRSAELLPLLHESVTRSASLRDNAAFLYGLTSLAEVLVVRGALTTAARLFGAAQALTERTGLHMQPPASRMLHEQHVARLRAELAADVLDREWSAGRSLSLAETFAAAAAASS